MDDEAANYLYEELAKAGVLSNGSVKNMFGHITKACEGEEGLDIDVVVARTNMPYDLVWCLKYFADSRRGKPDWVPEMAPVATIVIPAKKED